MKKTKDLKEVKFFPFITNNSFLKYKLKYACSCIVNKYLFSQTRNSEMNEDQTNVCQNLPHLLLPVYFESSGTFLPCLRRLSFFSIIHSLLFFKYLPFVFFIRSLLDV